MSTNPEIASLTRWLAELSKQVRDLAIGNTLNHAEVVDASGQAVLISQLAFGSVHAVDLAEVSATTPANSGPGGQGWFGWGPAVWVYVTGGKLRVDIACQEEASGNKCSAYMSYGVYGPSAAAGGAIGPNVAPPTYDRSVETMQYSSGMGARNSMGTFGLHTGLPPGWYYVQAQYATTYSNWTSDQWGIWRNRRLLATPF